MSLITFILWIGSGLLSLYWWKPTTAQFALHNRYYSLQDVAWALFSGPLGLMWVGYQKFFKGKF